MSKIKKKKETVRKITQLTVLNPNVAGIDVSDTTMVVAIPINSKELELKTFNCYTCDLRKIVNSEQLTLGKWAILHNSK